jgi:hypothetical protein
MGSEIEEAVARLPPEQLAACRSRFDRFDATLGGRCLRSPA